MIKKGLDEMQLQKRNKIGNQAFLMLLYLLLLDTWLYGFGFRWLNYPANIMAIVSVCSAVYLIRLIKGNAYVGPSPEAVKPVRTAVLTVLVAVSVAIVVIFIMKNAGFRNSTQLDDMTAPILFIAAAVSILVVVTVCVIKKIQNKDDEE